MKLFDLFKPSKAVERKVKQQQESKTILQGKIKPKQGHKVFEINTITREVKPAEYKSTDVDFRNAAKGDYSNNHQLVINKDCVYIPALNKENALRKFNTNPHQHTYYSKPAPMSFKQSHI